MTDKEVIYKIIDRITDLIDDIDTNYEILCKLLKNLKIVIDNMEFEDDKR